MSNKKSTHLVKLLESYMVCWKRNLHYLEWETKRGFFEMTFLLIRQVPRSIWLSSFDISISDIRLWNKVNLEDKTSNATELIRYEIRMDSIFPKSKKIILMTQFLSHTTLSSVPGALVVMDWHVNSSNPGTGYQIEICHFL